MKADFLTHQRPARRRMASSARKRRSTTPNCSREAPRTCEADVRGGRARGQRGNREPLHARIVDRIEKAAFGRESHEEHEDGAPLLQPRRLVDHHRETVGDGAGGGVAPEFLLPLGVLVADPQKQFGVHAEKLRGGRAPVPARHPVLHVEVLVGAAERARTRETHEQGIFVQGRHHRLHDEAALHEHELPGKELGRAVDDLARHRAHDVSDPLEHSRQ